MLLKDFAEILQNFYWEKYAILVSDTCLKFMVIFSKIVIIFLGRNTPYNRFVDVTNKETNKVMSHRCWSSSIMNLEELIFTKKGRQLVLALFANLEMII